ncbi:MAG: hypothetical protein GC192_06775 [Bacteroidetes bacterium]|nr:hypothetical protein [Bacteroidota bacterium]
MSRAAPNEKALLAKIFFPGQHLCAVTRLFSFGKKSVVPGFHCLSFGYVNNPDGTIRWLYPLGSRRTVFLRLYNGSGWRGFLFQLTFKTVFLLRNDWLLRSGQVHVFYKETPPFSGLIPPGAADKMAIFTGTVGENRKAVIAFEDVEGKSWFYKQPLTEAAARLVANEGQVLSALVYFELEKMQAPKAKHFDSGLLVSDVKPQNASNSFYLQNAHFEAVVELSERTAQQDQLGSLPFWAEITANLEALRLQPVLNGLEPKTVGKIIKKLQALYDAFDTEMTLTTTIAHGDFTPWNMYLGTEKLHVYDWELAERLPLLNDIFHFIFQSGVLVKKQGYDQIHAAIFSTKKNKKIRALLDANSGDFEQLYLLYLLRNTSYYLLKYLRQNPLHEQAHWLLSAWDLGLEAMQGFFPKKVTKASKRFADTDAA